MPPLKINKIDVEDKEYIKNKTSKPDSTNSVEKFLNTLAQTPLLPINQKHKSNSIKVSASSMTSIK